MSGLEGARVLVAGAGAIGSMVAWRLARAGAEVVLADPAARGDNASGIAAGMLAPAFEAVLDPASAAHFHLYAAARDRWWPAVSDELATWGASVSRAGALWVGDEASLDPMLERLRAAGASGERLTAEAARRLSPGVIAPAGAAFTPEDWRLDPPAMLRALHETLAALGGRVESAVLVGWDGRSARFGDGGGGAFDRIVLATGMPPAGLADPPPELACLVPIKGQIARLAGAGPGAGPVLRAEGIYLVPGPGGAILGATMEPGKADRRVEPGVIESLRGSASRLFQGLDGARIRGAAGVRASTPDSLPMVGPSSRPGVMLALGARRNGWLLAPLIAEILLAQLDGDPPGEWAARLDPLRPFSLD